MIITQMTNAVRMLIATLLACVLSANANAESQLYFVHTDHLGTPQVVTDNNQNVVWKGEYTPFGEVKEVVSTLDQNVRFPGQFFDQETGLHYNYFRDYDPSLGRYVQSDPIGLDGGINTYGYAYQNPISSYDTYGLFVQTTVIGCIRDPACVAAAASVAGVVAKSVSDIAKVINAYNDGGSCPDVPEDYTGENENGNGKTDLPGGEKARDDLFDELTGGKHIVDANGNKIGPNGIRTRTGQDGRPRIDIPAPASGTRGPETIHFNP